MKTWTIKQKIQEHTTPVLQQKAQMTDKLKDTVLGRDFIC